jgi:hypothetical protein
MMKTRAFYHLLFSVLCIGLILVSFAQDGQAAHLMRPGNPILEPAANSHGAHPDSPISITYSEAIDPDTVTPQTFAVQGSATGSLMEALSVDGDKITLTPLQPFHAGEIVSVSATTGTLSLVDGLGPLEPTVWQFQVMTVGSSGYLKDTGQELGEENSLGVALGDLDGDGDLDAFVANCGPSFVWLNDGTGKFTDSGQRLGPEYCSVDVALGDLDGDGDLDAFLASSDFGTVWLNDGSGIFTDSGQILGDTAGSGVALGDLDGDSDLDAFYVRKGPSKVLFNDGNGNFIDSGQILAVRVSTDVALGDLDGDGDLDAYIGNTEGGPESDQVLFNDGSGYFTESEQNLSDAPVNGVALGDLDGDGDLDVYLAVTGEDGPDEVWFNNGSGHLTDSGQRLGIASGNQVVLMDLDGDGSLDAFIANLVVANQIWVNDGVGHFSLSKQFLGQSSSTSLEMGDLDGDRDIDAFLTDFGAPATVWINEDFILFRYLPFIWKR